MSAECGFFGKDMLTFLSSLIAQPFFLPRQEAAEPLPSSGSTSGEVRGASASSGRGVGRVEEGSKRKRVSLDLDSDDESD